MQASRLRTTKEGHGLSDSQISELKEAYSLFDKDGDGNITLAELGNMMNQLGYQPNPSELEALLVGANTSNSGAIDFPEFIHFIGRMQKRISEQDICREAWRIFDPAETGWISTRELVSVLESVGEKLGKGEALEMIKWVVGADNERIGYDEFVELMTNSSVANSNSNSASD
jgi:calmodulin